MSYFDELWVCPICKTETKKYYSSRCTKCDYPFKSKQFQCAWRKGYDAPIEAKNPYVDWRTSHNAGVTFARSYRNAWEAGHVWRTKELFPTDAVYAPPDAGSATGNESGGAE